MIVLQVVSSVDNSRKQGETTPLVEGHENLNSKPDDRHPLLLQSSASSLLAAFQDDRGSAESLRAGLMAVLMGGILLGVAMPKNPALPATWNYPTISSVIGYTYFLSWSVSFYPQVITNYKKHSTVGLSTDFTVINHIGYICYSTYTACLFWNTSIQGEYHQRHGADSKLTVQSNDVAFALHALVLSFVWIVQIHCYGKIQLSSWIQWFLVGLLLFSIGSLVWVVLAKNGGNWKSLQWLDLLYVLSMVKVMITITKYVPQVMMNWRRQSTSGWTVWNVTLDIFGGILSLVQLVWDSYMLNDWSGITGNLAKLGLAAVTIFFDILFLFQHYVWYPSKE